MTQTCTTVGESYRLLNLGIDPKTADIFHPSDYSLPRIREDWDTRDNLQGEMPAWSLGALIELMPDTIILDDRSCCGLSILNMGVYYRSLTGIDIIQGYEEDNIFENCINMIEWLVKNNYIMKEHGK